jgi:hypothetical protein
LVEIQDDGGVRIYKAMEVVEEVEDEEIQVSLSVAKKVRKDVQL